MRILAILIVNVTQLRGLLTSSLYLATLFSFSFVINPGMPGRDGVRHSSCRTLNNIDSFTDFRRNEIDTKVRDSSDRQSWDFSREGSQNASVHFRDHIGQPSSYPRKFGLYNSHMYEGGGDSSTEDDSHRNGSYHSSYVSSPQGTPSKGLLEADLQVSS